MNKFSVDQILPEVSIIIASFNTKELLKECLYSIFKDKSSSQWEVVVVDNGSSDASVTMIKSKFPQVRLIENRCNLGFATAQNQGLKSSHGKYILFLNSDTIVTGGVINSLVQLLASNTDVGLVSPKMVNKDHSIQPSCFHFPSVINTIKAYWLGKKELVAKYAPASDEPVCVDAVVGAAMMLPSVVAKDLGGFDQKYFFYFEDLDLCRRLKQKGWLVVFNPKEVIIHHHGAGGKPAANFKYLKESLLYPIKKIIGLSSENTTHNYIVESSILYFGWLRHLLITLIIRFVPRS